MVPGANALALLDPGIFASDDDQQTADDPRRKLIKLAALQQLSGQTQDGTGTGTEATPESGEGQGQDVPASPPPSPPPSAVDKLTRAASIAPMPTETPASAPMAAAASRLHRAQQPFQPQGLKRDLVRAALTAAPAAIGGGRGAGGAVEGSQIAYQRNLTERSQAAQQYEFEAGRQERERDQAIKERLAEAQIQSQAAYRALMVGLAGKRADTGQQNADTRADAAAATQHDKGMIVTHGADGVSRVIDLPADKLPIIRQAQLGVAQATEDLKKAQTAAIPEQIDIAKRRLDIQSQMLQKALAGLEIQKANSQRGDAQFEVNYGITPKGEPSDMPSRVPGAMQFAEGGGAAPMKVAGQLGPGGMEKSRGGAAQNAQTTLAETAKLIRDNKDVLGPIWGRISLAGLAAGTIPEVDVAGKKIGYTPAQRQALEKIVVSAQSAFSFTSTAHGWRSAEAPAKFEQAVGGLTRDPEMTATGMETLGHNMGNVIKSGSTVRGGGAGTSPAVSRLKKNPPANAATPPANAPPASKVRKWTEFVNQ